MFAELVLTPRVVPFSVGSAELGAAEGFLRFIARYNLCDIRFEFLLFSSFRCQTYPNMTKIATKAPPIPMPIFSPRVRSGRRQDTNNMNKRAEPYH